MKIGFLYAGQGAHYVGMGKDFYEAYPEFKETFDKDFGVDVKRICFEGPEDELNFTANTQPCMVAFAVGVTKVLDKLGIRPDIAAGLSLGEYSALYAAGVFTEDQVIPLVAYRGKAMVEAAAGRDCKMIAVIALDKDKVKEGCAKVNEEYKDKGLIAEPANFNCPGQITVSGDSEAVDRAAEVLKELGAKRCLPVKVSGPFHTSLMKPAGEALRERFASENFGEMNIPVVFNSYGSAKRDEEKISDILVKQVQSSVYLDDSIRYMVDQGVELFVEIGPGNTLSKFVQKTTPDVPCIKVDKVEDIEVLKEKLGL